MNRRKNPSDRRSRAQKSAANQAAAAPRAPLAFGRKWLFRIVAMALPVLAMAMLEVILRLAGYGYPTDFFLPPTASNGEKVFIDNAHFTYRFFPPELARWPDTIQILRDKPPDTYRIFVLGESAAMGDPQPAYAASRYLDVLLRERFPRQKFEMVNLGITAINSHVIRAIAEDCAARGSGDIWILYIGNNEMIGPFGAASVFGSRAPPLAAVRVDLALQRTRVGQLLVALLRDLGGGPNKSSWGGMKMFLANQVPPADPRRETVYSNFAANLQAIVDAGLRSGAEMILNTVAVNLRDSPPFASQNNSNLPATDLAQFQQSYAAGTAAQRTNVIAAADWFSNACRVDPLFAEAHFRWAEGLAAASNYSAARQEFQRACDTDALPFRADARINAVIRTLATNHTDPHLKFCDAQRVLAEVAPAGIPGAETFFEHVHFRWEGNYRLGKLWAEQVADVLPAAVRAGGKTNWVGESFCDQAIGLSPWNKGFVLGAVLERMDQAPLKAQFNNASRIAALRDELAKLRDEQSAAGAVARVNGEFLAALQRAPQDAFLPASYASFLEARGDRLAALVEYRKITSLLPEDYNALVQTSRLLAEGGQLSEARRFLDRATQQRPFLPDPWYGLGVVLASQSNYVEALDYFKRAAEIRPGNENFLAQEAKMLGKLGRPKEAILLYRHALSSRPDWFEAHFALAGELATAGEVADSIHEYEAAIRLNPQHLMSHMNLGVMLVRQNRLDEAIAQFQTALRLDPKFAPAKDYLHQVSTVKNQSR